MVSQFNKLDLAMLEACPHGPLDYRPMGATRLVQRVVKELPTLENIDYILPIGSHVQRTLSTEGSGLDLLCVVDSVSNGKEDPMDFVESFRAMLAPILSIQAGRGVVIVSKSIGKLCLLPAVRRSDGQLYCADGLRGVWLPVWPFEHIRRIQSTGPIGRCVIRFAKAWNDEQKIKLDPYDIDAITIKCFLTTSNPVHFHWRAMSFFYESLLMLENAQYAMDAQFQGYSFHFNYLSTGEREMARDQVRKASDAAWNAWFLTEIDAETDPKGPIAEQLAWYTKILSP